MAKSSHLGLLVTCILATSCGSSPSSDVPTADAGVPAPPAVGPRAARDVLNVIRGFSVRRARTNDAQAGFDIRSLLSTTTTTPGPAIGLMPRDTAPFSPGAVSADLVLRDAVAERIDVAEGMLVPRLPVWTLRGLNHRATVALPRRATGIFALTDADSKLGIEVAMQGVADVPADAVDGYVVYAGATQGGGHVVHRPTAEGTEDFVYVPGAGTESLRYRVALGRDIAGLRLVSNTLEFLDAGGTPRLRVAPPYVVDSAGTRVDARLNVEGCRYDTNPAGPWGRAVTAPGATNCSVEVTWDEGALKFPILVDPAWTTTGYMATMRAYHTATLLGSGKVLIAGGSGSSGGLSSAELFDGTGTFAATNSMKYPRANHTATLLGSGKVLIAGGSYSGSLASAELFDGTSAFAYTGYMTVARSSHTASLLGSGKVLIAGGVNSSGLPLSSAELFDGTSAFASTGSMATTRTVHTATLLGSGKVLVAGGYNLVASTATPLSSAEQFDGLSAFSATGSMTTARSSHTATVLGSGKVLIAGGYVTAAGILSTAELFDGTGTFAVTGSMTTVRGGESLRYCGHTATLLGSGKVLIAGGRDFASATSSAEMFATTGMFAATDSMAASRYGHTATLLGSGKVLIAGGWAVSGSSTLQSAELFAQTGQTCTASSACPSGLCVDGVCCDSACTNQCVACDVPGKEGTCSPVAGAAHGSRTPCDKTGTTCGATCNGTDTTACHYPATTTTCSSNSCASGTETHASFCDGSGICNDVSKSCAPYVCGTSACKSACTSPTDCAVGFTCTSNVCTALPASKLGDPCTDASTCPSGAFCTDGVCCAVIGCSSGSSCSVNKKGTCAKLAGTSCASGLECGSSFCADGVCCDRACDGQCEACDHAGTFGTCTSIIGAPHGTTRSKCDAGTTTCAAKTCDGKDGSKCATFVGTETTCATPSCSSATYTGTATCDGTGSCKTPSPQACAPYGCSSTGCRSDCSVATDCADGFTCAASKCVPSGSAAVCSQDGLSSVAKDTGIATPCSPFKCAGDGKCGTSCGTSDDCAPGNICDTSTSPGRCVVSAPASTSSSGGCSMGTEGKSSGIVGLGLMAGLMALARARRRSRLAP